MPVTIRLPTPLRKHADQERAVEVTAGTVDEALQQLTAAYPGMKASIYGDSGALNRFVRVFVGERDIADLGGTATALEDGDVVSLICPIAGG